MVNVWFISYLSSGSHALFVITGGYFLKKHDLPPSAYLRLYEKTINKPVTRERELLSTFALSSCSPCAPKLEAEVSQEQVLSSSHMEGNSEECPGSSTACSRARGKGNKRKPKPKDESSSDSEAIVPRRIRFRGQARRLRNSRDTISSCELGKLDSATFLHYFMHVWSAFPEEKLKSVTYFDPLWFNLYANEKDRAMVLKWVKEKGVFSKKYVLVPIVLWSHWSLLICCNLGESLQSKTTTPCLLLLDSLRAIGPKRLEPLIRRLLLDLYTIEGRLENKQQLQQLKKTPLLIPPVPQQRKGEECGYYVLYYISLFLESAPENFNLSEGYPYFMKKDWFTDEGVESFYKTLDAFPTALSDHDDSDSSSDCIELIEMKQSW
ncbi:hypothetical protein ACJIZ3_017473 [Penstemon smallii]|uniref:Ubiquitin-like protease family profile domain-containing protein n=1 Tax=Penstemon smallii TaxID=265156 RepID=A0ABD3SWE5_9LAMI